VQNANQSNRKSKQIKYKPLKNQFHKMISFKTDDLSGLSNAPTGVGLI